MLAQIRNFGKGIARNLVSLDSQPIGKAALTVVLFLDFFILISIFNGLAEHTRQLTDPSEYIPMHCRDMVIKRDWNEMNQLTRIGRMVSDFRESYMPYKVTTNELHPICEPISTRIDALKRDTAISTNFRQLLQLKMQLNQTGSGLEHVREAYDTSLLETITRGESGDPNSSVLSSQVANASLNIEKLLTKERLLKASLMEDQRLIELFAMIETISEEDRNRLADEVRNLNFWHPAKRLGMEFMFLLPLVALFYFWNVKSVAASRPFQVLVSSHLMVIVFVPVVIKIAELVYDIIPQKLLRNLLELLESLRLVALWHYLLMGLAILAAMALVYLFQKKLFSQEKLLAKRISRGLCQNCGIHLPPNSLACPMCGFEQYRQCKHCDQATYIYGKYCRECGRSQ